MRLKWGIPVIVAVLTTAAIPGGARAAHGGATGYPADNYSPEQCCMPAVRYQVCYRTVEEERTAVRYRPVYHTVMKECRYTTCHPVYEQHVRECRYTVCRPVYEDYDVVRKYTVCHPVYQQHV